MHFSCLPNELQCEIFYHSLPINSLARFSKAEAPLVLLSVCKAWRALTLSTSKIWSHFEIYLSGKCRPEDEQRVLEGVQFWLRLSKVYPLSVNLTCEPPQQGSRVVSEILSLLLAQHRRLRHLELSVPSTYLEPLFASAHDFPILTSFAIDTRGVWSTTKTLDICALGINWSQLTNLYIGLDPCQSIGLDECLDILTESINLSSCVLNAKATFNGDVHRDLERISLPTLSRLHLILHDPGNYGETEEPTFSLVSFLDKLDPSMLEAFQIEWLVHSWVGNEVWENCHVMFMSFLERLRPTLLSLHLSYLPMSEVHLTQCLSMTPFLNHVDLRFNAGDEMNDPISDDLLKALTYKSFRSTLLPCAQSINLQCSGKKCSPSAVAELIDSRTTPKELGFREFKMMTYSRLSYETGSLCRWESEGVDVAFDYIHF
ncbi:hypothetical protein VKT23_002536 [Stygiomarasmius scandens]|uniref:F-box domain-containing protein n=1 Tax=Marasmiellus scandens TaxID=2682957 RepID=A0ABR1K6C2_9AGAR